MRSDVELALGRAYAAAGQSAKAAEIFANIYYTMPASADADAAYAELRKLPSVPPANRLPAQNPRRWVDEQEAICRRRR